jgi:hypothetical protein
MGACTDCCVSVLVCGAVVCDADGEGVGAGVDVAVGEGVAVGVSLGEGEGVGVAASVDPVEPVLDVSSAIAGM